MNFSLIICTYQRPEAIVRLLNSVQKQLVFPNEILVVDGSINNKTELIFKENEYNNLRYLKVDESDCGLTKQRNIGITNVSNDIDIVCFLDDDIVLTPTYFENLLASYRTYPKAIGIGGYITNEVSWIKQQTESCPKNNYCFDGYSRKEGARFKIRKFLNLIDSTPPGFMPTYSHGRSISYLPPSDTIYKVEYFMGGVSSFKKELFEQLQFSTYFEGYGLYEDLDFCLRASKIGKLYVNTSARLAHYHEESGRPNNYSYGKMVVRNGWYVWKVKYSNPALKPVLKFHLNVLLLTGIRFLNSFYGNDKAEAFTESMGRIVGWISLFLNKPKVHT